jgi:hypothetical protein
MSYIFGDSGILTKVYGIVSVTVDPSKLQSIIDRLEAGNPLKSEDLEILVAGLVTKQVIMATGKSAIALGTSADGATISSGDRNIIIPKEIAEAIQAKIGGNIDLHSGDRTVVNNYFFNLSADATEKNNRSLQQLHILLEEVNPEIVQQAYQKSLPVDANLWGIREENRIFNPQQLSKFVGDLIGNELIPQEIREKLNQTFPRSSGSNPVKSSNNQVLESYLSIAIRPSSTPDRFFVNGWLIADSSIKDNSQRFYPLDLDEIDKGIACGLDEIPKVLNNLLELGLQQLKGKQHELTIEISCR